jgi:PKD repeat protein
MRNCLIVIILLGAVILSGTILHVPTDYRYISLAIMASVDGDTILVEPGNYTGIINFNGKAITLTSEYIFTENEADIHHTRLLGSYSDTSLISFVEGEDENSVLNGFTITNSSSPQQGGAISCTGSSPTLSNLRFIDNQATSGGAIIAVNSSSPAIIKSNFLSNSGEDYGGAIYLEDSELVLENCRFEDNFCGGDDVSGRAGAIYLANSFLYCNNTIFLNNSSQAHAGAIYLSYSGADFYNTQFIGNTASGNVGAVYFYNSNHLNVINCTFYDNSGSDAGALRFFHNTALTDVPLVLNTICWNNTPSEITFSPDNLPNEVIIAYSDLEGGEEAIITNNNGEPIWLEGNIDENPMFYSPENHLYSLQADSPCLDSGTDYFEYEGTVYLDLDAAAYLGESPDMGAWESDPANPPVIARFSCDVIEGEAPIEIQFTDESFGAIEEWHWDFDNDGVIDSNEQSPCYIYTEAGIYSVHLTVVAGTASDDEMMIDLIEITAPSGEDNNQIANVFADLSLYPNPFNPHTTILYHLASDDYVKITAYNIRGQEVRLICEGNRKSGRNSESWDAGNLSNGIYLIRLQTASQEVIKKAVLLK